MFNDLSDDIQSLILQFAFPMWDNPRRNLHYTKNFFIKDLYFVMRVQKRIPSFFLCRTMPVKDELLIYKRSPFIEGNAFIPLAHFDRCHMFNAKLLRAVSLMKPGCFGRMKTYKAIKIRRIRRLMTCGIAYWNQFLDEFLEVEMTNPLNYDTRSHFQRLFIWELCSSLEGAMYF